MYADAKSKHSCCSSTWWRPHRHGLQPRPRHRHAAAVRVCQLRKGAGADVEVGGLAAHAAIDDCEVDAAHAAGLLVQALGADAQPAQRIHVGVAAGLRGVEDRVANRHDIVAVTRGLPARAERRRVISEIAREGLRGRWERNECGFGTDGSSVVDP